MPGLEMNALRPKRRGEESRSKTYLLAVQAALVGFEHDISLAADVQTGRLHLLDAVLVAFVLVRADDLFHLLWCDL